MAISLCPFCRTIILDTDFPPVCLSCGRVPASASGGTALPAYPSYEMAPGTRSSARDEDDDDEDDDDADDAPPPKRRPSSGGSGAGTAAAGAAAGAAGMGLGLIVLIVGGIAACCICIVAVPAITIPIAITRIQEAALRTQGSNNLKQIAMACHSHHDRFRHLPSPKMQPQPPLNVAPNLSWRVSILEQMNQVFLYNDFDRTQGWDQGKNKNLETRMPFTYRAPGDSFVVNQTPYQFFTGPGTMFPNPLTKITMVGIGDGTSNTFLCAEAATQVPWSKVADMAIQPQGALPLPKEKFLVALADGSVRMVDRSKANDDVLRLLIDPNDGKVLPAGWDQ